MADSKKTTGVVSARLPLARLDRLYRDAREARKTAGDLIREALDLVDKSKLKSKPTTKSLL